MYVRVDELIYRYILFNFSYSHSRNPFMFVRNGTSAMCNRLPFVCSCENLPNPVVLRVPQTFLPQVQKCFIYSFTAEHRDGITLHRICDVFTSSSACGTTIICFMINSNTALVHSLIKSTSRQ